MGSTKPLSVAALSNDYEKSRAEMRRKYDGKEIIVSGFTASPATMPKSCEDQGSVFLAEKDGPMRRQVTCWFTKDQAKEFSNAKVGEFVTVKGVFSGEIGPELRFCKLVKIE